MEKKIRENKFNMNKQKIERKILGRNDEKSLKKKERKNKKKRKWENKISKLKKKN